MLVEAEITDTRAGSFVILQGDLVAPPGGGTARLDAAGFQVIVKTPAAAGQEEAPP